MAPVSIAQKKNCNNAVCLPISSGLPLCRQSNLAHFGKSKPWLNYETNARHWKMIEKGRELQKKFQGTCLSNTRKQSFQKHILICSKLWKHMISHCEACTRNKASSIVLLIAFDGNHQRAIFSNRLQHFIRCFAL